MSPDRDSISDRRIVTAHFEEHPSANLGLRRRTSDRRRGERDEHNQHRSHEVLSRGCHIAGEGCQSSAAVLCRPGWLHVLQFGPITWRPIQNCSRKAAKYDLRECATSDAFFERSENRVRAQGPLWVISRHSPTLSRCLLYPQKRILISRVVMSALCQKRTLCAAANSRHSITSSECASRG